MSAQLAAPRPTTQPPTPQEVSPGPAGTSLAAPLMMVLTTALLVALHAFLFLYLVPATQ